MSRLMKAPCCAGRRRMGRRRLRTALSGAAGIEGIELAVEGREFERDIRRAGGVAVDERVLGECGQMREELEEMRYRRWYCSASDSEMTASPSRSTVKARRRLRRRVDGFDGVMEIGGGDEFAGHAADVECLAAAARRPGGPAGGGDARYSRRCRAMCVGGVEATGRQSTKRKSWDLTASSRMDQAMKASSMSGEWRGECGSGAGRG